MFSSDDLGRAKGPLTDAAPLSGLARVMTSAISFETMCERRTITCIRRLHEASLPLMPNPNYLDKPAEGCLGSRHRENVVSFLSQVPHPPSLRA